MVTLIKLWSGSVQKFPKVSCGLVLSLLKPDAGRTFSVSLVNFNLSKIRTHRPWGTRTPV